MKKAAASLLVLLLTLLLPLRAQDTVRAQKPYELYAEFQEETRVELSDGAIWMMDKGDCFPVYMFKDRQTKVVLKLASATFQVDATHVKVLPEGDSGRALESYRKNLAEYLKKMPDVWRTEAKTKKGKEKEKGKEKQTAAAEPEKK